MTAPLSGIWNYLGSGFSVNGLRTGQNESGGFDIPAEAVPDLSSTDPAMQKLIDSGVLTQSLTSASSNSASEGAPVNTPSQYGYNVDVSQLPKTVWGGNLYDVKPMDSPTANTAAGRTIRDRSLVQWDSNYGWTTPYANTIDQSSQRDFYDYIGPLAMSVVFAGAGLAAAGAAAGAATAAGAGDLSAAAAAAAPTSVPWYASAGMNAARAIGSGTATPASLAMTALPGLTNFGIPPEIVQGAQMANTGYNLYNATQQASAPPIPPGYYPELFGDMNSVPSVVGGQSSQLAAKSMAPNAYDSSYAANSQVIT